MRKIAIALAAVLAVTATPMVAQAAPCKDAKGKFVKCPAPAAKAAPKKACRDAKGKFTKCPK
ncbi:hypothetical protein [Novosphingobium capsulatum]|uniref:hypothetical protein n=1 Tax=Novosphingobium capsulatum TaxID=13688 RepID=UPI0007885447|nr:hypothetical protein [Novosphingobium capsulatum]WQD92782.1 hypothetical protein U0041_17635 [Novosphingobium capsulatum]